MTKKRSVEELHLLWLMLDDEFLKLSPASHAKVATQVIDWVLWRERLRNGLESTPQDRQRSDIKTIAALRSMDSDDPTLLMLEKVFRRLADGRGRDAIRLLETAIKIRSTELNRRQTKIAQAPRLRRRHPLSTMVDPIVKISPGIKVNDLFIELRRVSKSSSLAPCAYDFSKQAFIPIDSKFPPVPKSALPDYLYRAKLRK
jgi:hypothetical protein